MIRKFIIKILLLLQILLIFYIENANLTDELEKLKSEIFEIRIQKEIDEIQAKMRNSFADQILRDENFSKIYAEIQEKVQSIVHELNGRIEPKMIKSKAKIAAKNLEKILYSLLNEPILMVHPEISQILKAEYSILQNEIRTLIAGREMGETSKSGATKGKEGIMEVEMEIENENIGIGQKMEELEKLVNLATDKIQTLVNDSPQLNGFGKNAFEYWLLFLMRKLAEDGLWLLDGMKEKEMEPYFGEMDLAYGQIGRHLDWLRGEIGGEREIWMDIAIDWEMAKQLVKMGAMKICRKEIFKKLAGRQFFVQRKIDRMEWKLFVVIGKILNLYYFEEEKRYRKGKEAMQEEDETDLEEEWEKMEERKRKREDGNNSDGSTENKLENILKNAPIIMDSKNQFPKHFTDILLKGGLIDSVESIESLVEHQKFMVDKLGDDYEWQNDEIIFNEFEKKITAIGDLLSDGITDLINEMKNTNILSRGISEMELIINDILTFLQRDKTELLVKKNATELNNKLEWILKILGNEEFGHILSIKFDNSKRNSHKLEEIKFFDGRLGMLQRIIVEFEYFLTRGQKLWMKFGNNDAIENFGRSKGKGKKHKSEVGQANSANAEIIKEIFYEEMKILVWMKKLEEIGFAAIELHVSLQKWHLHKSDPRLRKIAKEKFEKLKKFLNKKNEIIGLASTYFSTNLGEMNENGVRLEFVERKRLDAAIKKLIDYYNSTVWD